MNKIIILFFFAWSINATAQFTISGKVTNDIGEYLDYAVVYLSNTKHSAVTENKGSFNIQNISGGEYELICTYLGYETFKTQVNIQKNVVFNIVLHGTLYQLDELEIKANKNSITNFTGETTVKMDALKKENLGQDVPILLQQLASVVATSDAGAGIGYTGLRIRGVDQTRINVTINDIPLNDAESQNVFWVDLPDIASSTESLRIQRGVGPSTNGAGAYGGTVSLNTFGSTINPYAELSSSVGSFGTNKFSAKLNSGLMNNRFNVEARYSSIKSEGYIDRASSNLKSWYLEGSRIGSTSSIRIIAFGGHEITYQSWFGTPESKVKQNEIELLNHYYNNVGSLYKNSNDSLNLFHSGRTYNYYQYENQVDDYSQSHLQFHYAKSFNSKTKTKLALHYTGGEGFYKQYNYLDALSEYGLNAIVKGNDTIINANVIRSRWLKNDLIGLISKTEINLTKLSVLSIGVGINKYFGNHYGVINDIEGIDSSAFLIEYYRSKSNKVDGNIFVRYENQISSNIGISADLQYRKVNYDGSGTDNNLLSIDFSKKYLFFNPKFALNYKINASNKIIVSYAVANREPDRTDILDHPTTKQPSHESLYDTEISHLFTKNKLSLENTFYYMKYKNQLVVTGALNDVGSPLRVNVPHSFRLGYEMICHYQLSKLVNVGANITLSKNKIKEFNEILYDYSNGNIATKEINHINTDIALSPNITSGINFNFNPIKSFESQLLWKYVGNQFLDNTSNDLRSLNSYHFTNLRLKYSPTLSFTKEINFMLQLNNIFNQLYESNGYTYSYISGSTITENFLYPQAGFNWMVGLGVKF